MRTRLVCAGLSALLLAACGGPTPPSDTQTTDAADAAMMAMGLPGDEYCRPAMQPTCPSGAVATCGVCVRPPEDRMMDRLSRTSCANLTGTREFCDMANPPTAPNLSCFTTPPAAQTPRMVTVWGVVDVFGTGGDSNHVRIEIYNVNADGTPGMMLGNAVSDTSLPYATTEVELDTQGQVRQMRRLGAFQIPNIPTETPLLVRTVGDPSDPTAANDLWSHPIYDYTQPLRNNMITQGGANGAVTGDAVNMRPRAISNADWMVIPSTATLTTGIPMGQGALAGEVHDCDDVRLANAVVFANPVPNFDQTVYFSDNDTRPLPDLTRSTHGTQLLGLYAMLAMTPGQVRIAAAGYSPTGEFVHAGFYNARVFPNAVTVVTLRGRRPWQTMN